MANYAIITEYNPFHKGHEYQINYLRSQCNADNIFIIMSGNFVQRGSIAWTNKYLRARAALLCGADFVFEIPFRYATASAEQFALAGIMIANSLPVDYLCFGQETNPGDSALLRDIAQFLAFPSKEYMVRCQEYLSTGLSYPQARMQTLISFFPALQHCPELLTKPNNILSLEYQKALCKTNSTVKPFPIKRMGNDYHDTTFSNEITSASAIRTLCLPGEWDLLLQATPDRIHPLLQEHSSEFPMLDDVLSDLLYARLMQLETPPANNFTHQPFPNIADLSPELYNRLLRQKNNFASFTQFITALKTKQYTYTRISRALLHLLFNTPKDSAMSDYYLTRQPSFRTLPYVRLLGFSKKKSHLLRSIKDTSIITKTADASSIFAQNSETMDLANVLWCEDLKASNTYRYLLQKNLHTHIPDEYHTPMIIV